LAVAFVERAVHALEELARLRHELGWNADLVGEELRLDVLDAREGVDRDLVDELRRLLGDFLDVHATLGRSHHHGALQHAVDDDGEIELLGDLRALLDQQALHDAALGPGLVRDERHAQHLLREGSHFVDGFRDLHAAALAPAARVDLRLHDPDAAAQFLRHGHRLVGRQRRLAAWSDHPVLPEDLLALVLVDVHGGGRRWAVGSGGGSQNSRDARRILAGRE
jgi:hypothetical protein